MMVNPSIKIIDGKIQIEGEYIVANTDIEDGFTAKYPEKTGYFDNEPVLIRIEGFGDKNDKTVPLKKGDRIYILVRKL